MARFHSFWWLSYIPLYICIHTHTHTHTYIYIYIVQSLSCVRLCNLMNCSTPGLPVYHQLLEFIQTHVCQVGDAIQPSHPLSSPSPSAPNPSQHQGLFQWVFSSFFTWGGQSIGVSASASVLPMNTGLISFRMDWLDLLAVQGTLRSLLHHHSSTASILWHSAFFTYIDIDINIDISSSLSIHHSMDT